jgi:predicted nucleic acid-binding protein
MRNSAGDAGRSFCTTRGVKIPVNDVWIAALAVESGLPLLARDEHFSRVSGLTVIQC